MEAIRETRRNFRQQTSATSSSPSSSQLKMPPQTTTQPNGNHRPQNNHHHFYYPTTSSSSSSSSSSASFRGCCCCLFLLFSFIALLILAVVLIVFLAVKPKKPQFDLQQVGVQYMGISTPNTTSLVESTSTTSAASISLTIHMLFTAVNPNKVGIKYGESKFTVMYRGIPLGKASVPGFYQEAHSARNVEATIAVDRANLMQADAANLIKDASLNDRVELRILGDFGAKIRILNFDSPGVKCEQVFTICCPHPAFSLTCAYWGTQAVVVSVNCAITISPSKQALTSKQCGFDGFDV